MKNSVQEIKIKTIGFVESSVTDLGDENWGSVSSRITLLPEYEGSLLGLEDFSHAIVITYLHRAKYDPTKHLRRRPRGMESMPEVGIFSQRVKDRPNPIGVTAVEIMEVGDDYLYIRGLDAVDGTPVIDIKPYFPQFDRVENARIPEWVDRLMKNYF
jgi:tRNA-Thr(GGU) m(6)t(6)A37 methyltransferase TsaA